MIERARRKVERMRAASVVPRYRQSGDIFLVEFPKSGVTWLSVLLTNALLASEQATVQATFSSIRTFVTDLHVSPQAVSKTLGAPAVQFYKSHAPFALTYPTTVYLARLPHSVMRSYFNYSSALGYFEGNYSDFVFKSKFGIAQWKRHINSWFGSHINSNQFFVHLVRYEDLLANAAFEVQKISDNFGWALGTQEIELAVARSGRDAMVEQEDRYRKANPSHSMEFVSKSSPNAESSEIDEEILSRCSKEIALLGYCPSSGILRQKAA